MKEREYLQLKDKVRAEYLEKLRALDLVWKMSKESSPGGGGKSADRGSLTAAIRQFIGEAKGDFSINDVEAALKATIPQVKKPSIATVFRRLMGKVIEEVSRGSGRRSSTYRRIEGGRTDEEAITSAREDFKEVPF